MRRIAKAIIYRIITNVIVQTGSWLMFREVKINLVFALWEVFRTAFYYTYDWVWERRK